MFDPPPGYTRVLTGGIHAVAADHLAQEIRGILQRDTLHAYAEHHPQARALSGRGIAFSAPIGSERAVVRHNRHGGLLAPITRDLFLPPTRAPLELEISLQLSARGVPTPTVLGFAVYAGPAIWRRADLATREIPRSFDLGHALESDEPELRRAAVDATAELMRTLGDAGAHHEDLNVKNVLLAEDQRLRAWLLDVDRVVFTQTDPTFANVKRLLRSVEQRRKMGRVRATSDELVSIVRLAGP